jgi:hypothetical protein
LSIGKHSRPVFVYKSKDVFFNLADLKKKLEKEKRKGKNYVRGISGPPKSPSGSPPPPAPV